MISFLDVFFSLSVSPYTIGVKYANDSNYIYIYKCIFRTI